jgi:ribonuclease I
VNSSGRGRTWGALAIGAIAGIGALIAWFSRREAENSPPVPVRDPPAPAAKSTFDLYPMALTLRPAFCADGHERPLECRIGGRVLVIHGTARNR